MKTILLTLILASSLFASSASEHAEKLAIGSLAVKNAYSELKKLVEKVQVTAEIPENLKSTSLQLLNAKTSSPFTFTINERRTKELEIAEELTKRLAPYMAGKPAFESSEYATEKNPLFPKNDVMSFIAAPGSATGGHHVYPGGLVHHTYTNALTAMKLAETYEKVYRVKLSTTEKNLGLLASLWHDAAKTWVIKWNDDGTLTKAEGKIAGTSAHHIWVLAELAMREIPSDFIVAVAGAHDAIIEGQPSEQKVIGYLLAASILSGKTLEQVGLVQKENTLTLKTLPRLAHYLNNLGDADWAISVPAQKKALELVGGLSENSSEQRWKLLSLLSKHGEIPLYNAWRTGGEKAVAELLKQ